MAPWNGPKDGESPVNDCNKSDENGRKTAKVVVVNKNAHINALCSVHIVIGVHRIKLIVFNTAGMLTSETQQETGLTKT